MADQSDIQLLAAEVARLDALNKKLKAGKDAAEARLKDITHAKDEEIDALQTKLRTQKGLTEEAEANFDHLQIQTETSNKENKAAKEKIEVKDKEIAKLTVESQEKEKWISRLEEKLAELEKYVDENAKARMEAQIASLKTALATEKAAHKNLRDTYHEYQRSVALVQAQLQASNDRITQLEAQHAIEVERLTTENQQIQVVRQENAALEEQLARFTQEVNDDINREPEAHVAPTVTGQNNTLDQEVHSNLGRSYYASIVASSERQDDSEDGDTERSSSDSSSDDNSDDNSDDDATIQEVIRYVDVERIVQVNSFATTLSHNAIFCWFTTELGTFLIIKWALFDHLPYLMRSIRRATAIRVASQPPPNPEPNPESTKPAPEPNPNPEPTSEPVTEPDQGNSKSMASIAPVTAMNTVFPPSDSNPGPIPPAPLRNDPLPPLPNPAPPGQRNPNPAPNLDQPDAQNPPADTEAPRIALPASLSIWTLVFNLLLHILLYYLIYSTWKERSLWLAANGLTRSFVWGLTRFAERKGVDYSVWSAFFGEAVTESLDKAALRILEGLGGERKGWVVAG